MNPRHTERRIIYSLVVVLIAIQLAIYLVLRVNNERIARASLGAALQTGAHVTRSLLETRQRQLDESTRVLAGDFGLREAIATGDRPTVSSMLDNHEKRAQGLFIAVHDLGQRLLAKSTNLPVGQRLDALADGGARAGQGLPIHMAALDRAGETLFHLSVAEVRAPQQLAWISMGFAIDTAFAEELSRLTDMQFLFLARDQQGAWRLHGSTLPGPITAAAIASLREAHGADLLREAWTVDGPDDSYLLSVLPLSARGGAEVVAVMGRSLDQAMAPMREVERALLLLLAASLVVAGGAVYVVTRRLVAPINESAHRDTLTGLVNRRYFDAALRLALEEAARRRGRPLALLMLDLNKFKAINDGLGHAAGDEVLQIVARRLQQVVRASDTVARLGGDEFAVLLPGMGRAAVTPLLDKLVAAICEPFPLEGRTMSVGTSVGVAIAPDDGTRPEALMHRADQAMYRAKTGGGAAYAFHEAGDSELTEDLAALLNRPDAPGPGDAAVGVRGPLASGMS
ncbi:diguanylate cyclase [Piscinibacter sakaiensis]|uniref:Sensory box/GGDEF family protein n=1 Tax=Piscinibacter sakaiensis TaxID=1547922 RepID=A0A0K8NYW7_PISS1|nr:diguanylate cyclase [Piscinibacter sakaiensis]GAP35110.1 sensory box/GGDEF family protein [Piscinibacter sakaiensis]